MWKSESRQQTADSRQSESDSRACLACMRPRIPLSCCLLLSVLLFTAWLPSRHAGPAEDEAVSRHDVLSRWTCRARQPIEGTVARGFLRTDTEFFTGKKARSAATQRHSRSRSRNSRRSRQAQTTLILTTSRLFRCRSPKRSSSAAANVTTSSATACHGLTGNGDGMIVRRGFRRAASFQ